MSTTKKPATNVNFSIFRAAVELSYPAAVPRDIALEVLQMARLIENILIDYTTESFESKDSPDQDP
jgi:hypothetical protein